MPGFELMSQDLINSQDILFDEFIAEKKENLFFSERGTGKVLILDPDSASWAILPGRIRDLLLQLEKPVRFSSLCAANPSLSPDYLKKTMDSFYHHGFININGRNYFPLPEDMWMPVDDYPVYPRSFYFHMTDACNFRCTYCYANANSKGKSMSRETGMKIIDRIISDIPYDNVFVEFHGGEPLLFKDSIFSIVEYGKKKARFAGKNINFSIQTNGSLLTEDVIRFARSNGIKMGISCDGPPDIHNRYRIFPDGTGTFDSVWESIKRAESMDYKVGFIGVVHETDDYMKAYEFFVSRGILSFKLNHSAPLGRAAEEIEFREGRGKKMAFACLEMVDAAVMFNKATKARLKIYDINFYLAVLARKKREYMCLRSPCGVGRSIMAFGTQGEIYPCEEMSTYPEFNCGNICNEIPLTEIVDDSPAIKKLRTRKVENIPRCSKCPWRRFCGGKCLHKSYHLHNDLYREDAMCDFYSTMFHELMWKIDSEPHIMSLCE